MFDENSTQKLVEAWAAQSAWEITAVALAVIYLLLVIRQNAWCWVAALVSTGIYTALFWDVQLLMQSALNVFYLLMAVYGWWHWRYGGVAINGEAQSPPIVRWPWRRHFVVLLLISLAGLISGYLLSQHTEAALPYLDSLVTWAAVATTFMVARKVLENWIYWWVINSLAIVLFVERGLAMTAALHALYLVIAIFGWRRWLRDWRAQQYA